MRLIIVFPTIFTLIPYPPTKHFKRVPHSNTSFYRPFSHPQRLCMVEINPHALPIPGLSIPEMARMKDPWPMLPYGKESIILQKQQHCHWRKWPLGKSCWSIPTNMSDHYAGVCACAGAMLEIIGDLHWVPNQKSLN